jgi:hypothetical protein
MTQVLSLSPVFEVKKQVFSTQKFAESKSKRQKSLEGKLIVEKKTSENLNRISGGKLRHGGSRELGLCSHK